MSLTKISTISRDAATFETQANAALDAWVDAINAKAEADHSHGEGGVVISIVANEAALGTGATDGEIKITADKRKIFAWNAGASSWELRAPSKHKNFIINGCGEVNQRVTAYTLVKDAYCWDASNLYGPDMFEGMATGTLVTAGTFAQTVAANCGVSGFAFKFAGVTITGTGIIYFRYRMEAKDAVKFINQKGSFSCKVYQDSGGAINYTVYIRKADAADNFAAVTAISNSGANSILDSTETDLKYEDISMGACGNGIEIEIKVECGAITTKNFEFTEIQFELGSVATDFEYRQFQDELARCQRCFFKSYDYDVAPGTADENGIMQMGISPLGEVEHTRYHDAHYPEMRTNPMIVLYDAAGNSGKVSTGLGNNQAGTLYSIGRKGFYVGAIDADPNVVLRFHYTAVAEL